MNTKNSYFQKYAVFERLIAIEEDPGIHMCIVIPSHNEPDISTTLQSIVECNRPEATVEVIVVINHNIKATEDIILTNIATKKEIDAFLIGYKPWIPIHTIFISDMPVKSGGVGLARKIGMDEAARRLKENGIIVCLDADCTIDNNYLVSIENHFLKFPNTNGCSISFSHPISTDFPEDVVNGIAQYELHLRYFIDMQRNLLLPYAYHTVGSSMAVVNKYYMQVGGMNKRKAGEDFYFIQKLIKQGKFSKCTSTTVYPSPRISDRVPFGTGKAMKDILNSKKKIFYTYHPESFKVIGEFIINLRSGFKMKKVEVPEKMNGFISQSEMDIKITEFIAHTSSEKNYVKRMFHWFDAFKLMKALHYLRDQYFPLIPVLKAVQMENNLLKEYSLLQSLEFYRELDKQ